MISVYLIRCDETSLCYVGQTCNAVEYRWRQHCKEARLRVGNHPLYNAIKKYGKERFSVSCICICQTREEANKQEEVLIAAFKTVVPNGYNVMIGGRTSAMPQHVKDKISAARKGKPLSETHRAALTGVPHKRNPLNPAGRCKGSSQTQEVRLRISNALVGRNKPLRTPEHCAALREARWGN